MVDGGGLADAGDARGFAQTGQGDGSHFFIGQLIHEFVPLGIIIIIIHHVDQLQVGVLAHRREFHAGSIGQVGVVQHNALRHFVGHGQFHDAGGDGAFPVGAGIVHDFVAALAGIAVHIRVGEQGLHIRAGAVGFCIGVLVKGLVEGIGQGRVARAGQTLCEALGGQDVVGGLVGVFGGG